MSSNTETQTMNDQQDKVEKKQLVLKTIAEHCTKRSDFNKLRSIAVALESGDTLGCDVISGGATNYSYKVYLNGSPNIKIYAKLAFNYAGWNPDHTVEYDLERTANEFEMMKFFSELMGGTTENAPVATPFFLVEMPGDARLFVTDWATNTDEQLAKQAADGHIDPRVVTKVAKALALLNLQPVDPSWNDGIRANFRSLLPQLKALVSRYFTVSPDKADVAVRAVQEFGQERMEKMLETQHREMMEKREVLCHNDTHFLNILVEPRNGEHKEFGPHGDFVICDWEMSVAGPSGKDSGLFQAFPIANAMVYAVNGRRDKAVHLLQTTIDFFDAYANTLAQVGSKDADYLRTAFRQGLGATGALLFFIMYAFGLLTENLPLKDTAPGDAQLAKAAFGYVGFKCMVQSHGGASDLDLTELRDWYKNLVLTQIDELVALSSNQIVAADVSPRLERRCSDAFRRASASFDETSTHSINF